MFRPFRVVFALYSIGCALIVAAADLPTVSKTTAGGQLLAHGKPFLILGGEVGNSSASTAAQADSVLPRLARMHFNTVLIPVVGTDRAGGRNF